MSGGGRGPNGPGLGPGGGVGGGSGVGQVSGFPGNGCFGARVGGSGRSEKSVEGNIKCPGVEG